MGNSPASPLRRTSTSARAEDRVGVKVKRYLRTPSSQKMAKVMTRGVSSCNEFLGKKGLVDVTV